MKAREIKKMILHNYEAQTKEYKETMSHTVQDVLVRQAKIKQLEDIIISCFGIEKKFNFNFVYANKEIERTMNELAKAAKELM